MRERFRDREEAGRLLASALTEYGRRHDVVVLGLPRGGVPVAFEVAQRLEAPLDVFVVRKLGVAIASGDVRVINRRVVLGLGIQPADIEEVAQAEERELRRRERVYRGSRPPVPLSGRTAIVVDDGLATGATMLAPVKAVRQRGAAQVVVAVPVGDRESCAALAREADRCVPDGAVSGTARGQGEGDFRRPSPRPAAAAGG